MLGVALCLCAGRTATAQTAIDPGVWTSESERFWVEVEFLFARPNMKESFQATATIPPAGPMALVPFENDFGLSPRVELGYAATEDIGFRASYWHFDHNADRYSQTSTLGTIFGANVVSVIFPAAIAAPPGATLSVDSALRVQTLDLEAVVPLQVGRTSLTASGGLQYASLEQTYDASVLGTPIGLNWDRDLHGIGPTLALEARHPLMESGLSFVGGARGALLVAEKDLSRTVIGDISPTPAPAAISLSNAGEPTGIFELTLGVEWTREIAGWGDLFVGAQYESQLWTGAGAPTLTFLGFDGFATNIGLRF